VEFCFLILALWSAYTRICKNNSIQMWSVTWPSILPSSSIVLKEVSEWEHSEPGTGSPPIPAEKPIEKDAREGWRRDTPPIALEEEE
jgi:hypothetical protein